MNLYGQEDEENVQNCSASECKFISDGRGKVVIIGRLCVGLEDIKSVVFTHYMWDDLMVILQNKVLKEKMVSKKCTSRG